MTTTKETHPFILDLLAGWENYIADGNHHDNYHQAIYDLYQQAGVETVVWEDDAPEKKDLNLRQQFVWLIERLPALLGRLEALEGNVFTDPPVEDQDDDTPFEDGERKCEVILTDKVIQSALVFVKAGSRQEAAELAREMAQDDEVEWQNTYEFVGDVDVASVEVIDHA